MIETTNPISRWSRYSRKLEWGDFSLQANTEAVPEEGHFYLLQDGGILLCSDDYETVEQAYLGLCRDHWRANLDSVSVPQRLACAWGLLGLEPTDVAAKAVIERDGAANDRARLVRVNNRRLWKSRRPQPGPRVAK